MTIASSSGLNEKDIEKMVSDAEQFAESDKARKALIEESNKAESVCADTEKGVSGIHTTFRLLVNFICYQLSMNSRTNSMPLRRRRSPNSLLNSASWLPRVRLVTRLSLPKPSGRRSVKPKLHPSASSRRFVRDNYFALPCFLSFLFQVYEKRAAENASSEQPSSSEPEKKD